MNPVKCVAAALAAALFLPDGAGAQPQPKAATCTMQAAQKGLQGRARQQFMAACLARKPAASRKAQTAPAPASGENRVQRCTLEAAAKRLQGAERSRFMNRCLKR